MPEVREITLPDYQRVYRKSVNKINPGLFLDFIASCGTHILLTMTIVCTAYYCLFSQAPEVSFYHQLYLDC